MGKKFLIYGLIGWCAEVFWTGLGSLVRGDMMLSSFTYLWMFPIYGMAVFLEPVHDRIRNIPIILRGGIYTVLIFLIEYTTGSLLYLILGACPWNYSDRILNLNGIITLEFVPVWFTAGLLFEIIHDKMDYILNSLAFSKERI